jgi:hypothetical protein
MPIEKLTEFQMFRLSLRQKRKLKKRAKQFGMEPSEYLRDLCRQAEALDLKPRNTEE